MPSSSVFRLFVSCAAFVLGCHAHQLLQRPPALLEEQQQILRWGGGSRSSEELPKLASEIFGSSEEMSSSDRNRFLDENDASLSSDEQMSLLDGPVLSKRRKGPTLSVVSPLEVLRQRLRLDRAKERIRENQKQIVANEELLEKIGKRSGNLRALVGNLLQP